MKVVILFKVLAMLLLISTLMFIVYCWSKDSPISEVGERRTKWDFSKSVERNKTKSHASNAATAKGDPTNLDERRNPLQSLNPAIHDKKVEKSDELRSSIYQFPPSTREKNSTALRQKFHDRNYKIAQEKPRHFALVKAKRPDFIHREVQHDMPFRQLINSKQIQSRHVPSLHHLPPGVIKGIKKFVFFVGYARSGHSIIGTLMDAHPHVIISNEFNLFSQFTELNKASKLSWRDNLYNLLYSRSIRDKKHSRAALHKGYKLKVSGLWQGKFSNYIEVIGDKSGDITTKEYSMDPEGFLRNFKKLKHEVSIPLRIIHTVRNPFDVISTSVVIMNENLTQFRELKNYNTQRNEKTPHKYENSKVVGGNIPIFFKRIDTVLKLIKLFGRENVLDVHNCDLVADPRGTISRIFKFLEVDTTQHYLDMCAEKVFKTVSRSRNMVRWTPEQVEMVEKRMKN